MSSPSTSPSRSLRISPTQERWAANRAALYEVGDTMVAEALRSGEPMSVVVFEQVDLPELHAIFGSAAAQALVERFNAKLKLLAGSRGVALRAGATTWAVLLPGRDSGAAMRVLGKVLGPSLAVEAAVEDEELLLVPRVCVHPVGSGAESMRSIYREMREKIRRAHEHELLRQDYLRRERESHSRPAPLLSALAAAA
jgi:GGDEF domain-containing protein